MRYAAMLLLLSLNACATLMNGSTERVQVISDPPGGLVTVSGRPAGTTPVIVQVPRKDPGSIGITMAGCPQYSVALTQGTSGWVWGNALLAWLGLVTAGIDFATGAANTVNEDVVGARCINGVAVASDRIVVGMTAEQVRQAWGNPVRINRTATAGGSSEQWVYGLGYYVYVENGVVTAVQTVEGGER